MATEKNTKAKNDSSAHKVYEEWRMEAVNDKPEKLKMLRDNVNIDPWVAEALNKNWTPENHTALMYFEKEPAAY